MSIERTIVCEKCGSICSGVTESIVQRCGRATPPTHADRIRGMDDEELAKALYDFEDLCMPDYCQRKKKCDDMLDADIDIPAESCRRCLLDWLQQPAEEVRDGQTI